MKKKGKEIDSGIVRKSTDAAMLAMLALSLCTTLEFAATLHDPWDDGVKHLAQQSGHTWIYRLPHLTGEQRRRRFATDALVVDSTTAGLLYVYGRMYGNHKQKTENKK